MTEVKPDSTARYDAFISYSYAFDRRLAPALQRCLHRLAKPWYRPRALRVFRDIENLAANHDLWHTISTALAASWYFILLASPQAAASNWVGQEVTYWKENRERETFLIVLTDGTIRWDDDRGDFDWDHTTALPPQLRGWFTSEPLWVNLAWARQETELSLRHSRFRSEVATLAAPLHNRAKDELDSEDVRQHRLATRLRQTAVIALSLLTVVATVLWFVALDRQNELTIQRDQALSRQLAAESETLGDSDPVVAQLLSVAAWRISPTADAHTEMLRAAARPGIAKLQDGGKAVNSVAFSPDGRTIAIGGDDNDVRLVDVVSRQQVGKPLTDYGKPIQMVVFSPDGRTLATSGNDGAVRLWGLGTHEQIGDSMVATSFLDVGFHPPVTFSPDGKVVAIGEAAGTIRLRDVGTRQQVGAPLAGHIPSPLPTVGPAVAFSPDGTRLATAATDGTLRFWDASTHGQIGRPLAGFPADTVAFNGPSVVFSPDGNTVATSSSDGAVRLWDANKHQQIGTPLTGPTANRVTIPPAVAFSPSGKTLAIGGDDGTIRLWDVAKRQQVGNPLTGHTGPVSSVAFSPDETKLVSGARDGTVRLWDVSERQQFNNPLTGHTGPVYSAAFSPDGRTLATGGDDGGGAHNHSSIGACTPATGKGCSGGGPGRGALATTFLWNVGTRSRTGVPLTVEAGASGRSRSVPMAASSRRAVSTARSPCGMSAHTEKSA